MPFIPHTEDDIQAMLARIGAASIDDLFDEIPAALRSGKLTGMPPGMNEMDIARLMTERAEADGRFLNFIGAGAYEHHIPAAVWQIATRGEFYSAYTPYQAEASQGTLQLLYEFQTMMASLTGMDVSNASLYDGASGLAEAVLMAVRAHKTSRRVLMPKTVHPLYRQVVRQLSSSTRKSSWSNWITIPRSGITVRCRNSKEGFCRAGHPAAEFLRRAGRSGRTDRLGSQHRAVLVIGLVNPMALALLTPPGQWGSKGADIAVGDGQPLGVAAVQRRPLFRLHVLQAGAGAPDAGAHHRPHRGSGRQARLRADAAGARAAYPPRQGDLQHLLQPGPDGDGGDHPHGAARAGRPGARRRGLPCQHRALADRLSADSRRQTGVRRTVFHEVVLQLPIPVRGRVARHGSAGHRGRLRPDAVLPGTGAGAAGLRHRDQDRGGSAEIHRAAGTHCLAAQFRPHLHQACAHRHQQVVIQDEETDMTTVTLEGEPLNVGGHFPQIRRNCAQLHAGGQGSEGCFPQRVCGQAQGTVHRAQHRHAGLRDIHPRVQPDAPASSTIPWCW